MGVIKNVCKSIIQSYMLILMKLYNLIPLDINIPILFETHVLSIKESMNSFSIESLMDYFSNNAKEFRNAIECFIKTDNQSNVIQTCFHEYEYVVLLLPRASFICLIVAICALLYNTHNVADILQSHPKSSNESNKTITKETQKNTGAIPEKVSTPKTQVGRALKMQSAFHVLPKADLVDTHAATPMTSNTVNSTAYSAITLSPRLLSPVGLGSVPSPGQPTDDNINFVNAKNSKSIKNAIRFGEKAGMGDDLYSVMSQNDKYLKPQAYSSGRNGSNEKQSVSTDLASYVLSQAVEFPSILIGWRIHVPGLGRGLILGIQKKKFRCTHFLVQFDDENGKTMLLPLQRSEKKGTQPFTLLNKSS